MALRILVFLVLNFGALALGSYFTTDGVVSQWYEDLNKAPWTPPGWVFGAAWTTIMLAFTYYMAVLWGQFEHRKTLLILFSLQWLLNVGWNPVFFHLQAFTFGLVIITALMLLVFYFMFTFNGVMGWKTAFLIPYGLWLVIATSLNAYIVLKN